MAPDAEPARPLWAPDVGTPAIRFGDEVADEALRIQVRDPASDEYGGYRAPDTLVCEGRAAVNVALVLTTLWGDSRSRHCRSDVAIESVRLALAFFEERVQYDDGTIDGFHAGDMQAAANVAFAAYTLYDLRARWLTIDHPAAAETLGRCQRCMVKAGHALRTGGLFTPNHRWIACAAMARINEVERDKRLVAKIDDYLGDGIDQDADGFYSEYSPGYAMLCNTSFIEVARLLDRPGLVDCVRRNAALLFWTLQPNGEVACEFTKRGDTGAIGSLPVLLEMARREQDGRYLSVARAALDRTMRNLWADVAAQRGTTVGAFYQATMSAVGILEVARAAAPTVAAEPAPDSYRRTFPAAGIARIRRGSFSATIIGRPGSTNLLAVRCGDTIIDGTRIGYRYYGSRIAASEGLAEEDGEYVIRHAFARYVDGPVAARTIDFHPDLGIRLGIREIPDGLALSLSALGHAKVSVFVEFAVRPEGMLSLRGDLVSLGDGERHDLTAGGPVRIINGRDALEIAGDLVVEHRILADGKFTRYGRMTSLVVAPRTPYDGTITIRGYHD